MTATCEGGMDAGDVQGTASGLLGSGQGVAMAGQRRGGWAADGVITR